MASTKKITRKEIKQPDEFITLSGRAIEWARGHVREVIIGVALLLALGLALWAWSVYAAKQEARASHLLAEAQALLRPPAPATAGGQAADNRTAKADPDAEARALALLQDLAKNYRRTDASRVGRLLLAQGYYEDGKYDEAIEMYEDFLKTGSKPELKAMAQEGLAYSYEAKKNFTHALDAYEKLSRMPLANVQGWAYMGMARCYERLGKLQKAIDTYRKLLAEYPQHPDARVAKATIARLTQSLGTQEREVKKPD